MYEIKDYLESAQKFSEAFKATGGQSNAMDRYKAACSWALANEIDSSFVQLFKAVNEHEYSNYDHITTDPDLDELFYDPRWKELLVVVRKNQEKKEEAAPKSKAKSTAKK